MIVSNLLWNITLRATFDDLIANGHTLCRHMPVEAVELKAEKVHVGEFTLAPG